MTIGGIDIVIPAKTNKNLVEIIIKKMRELWPEAVFQDHGSEEQIPINDIKGCWFDTLHSDQLGFFIYKDDYIALNWDNEPELKNQMLYFLIDYEHKDENYVTIVCDEEDDFINGLVKYFSEKVQ